MNLRRRLAAGVISASLFSGLLPLPRAIAETPVAAQVLTLSEASARFSLKGSFRQGGSIFGQAPDGTIIMTVNGQPLELSADRRFLFGIGRDQTGDIMLEARFIDAPPLRSEAIPIQERSYRLQKLRNVSNASAPPEIAARIAAERARVVDARSFNTASTDWAEGWVWPATGRRSGVYGSARTYNETIQGVHWGVDVAAPTGTPVRAPAGGIIRLAETGRFYEGGLVIIDHGQQMFSALMHLSAVDVTAGQRVERGENIGKIGATGRVTGAHLDWRINLGDVRIDPELLPGLPPFPAQ